MNLLSHVMLAALLAGSALMDLKERRIPNLLTFPAWALGVGLGALGAGAGGGGEALAGSLVGAGVWLPAFFAAAMGAGDVKLMAAAGAFLGPEGVLRAFWLTLPAGGALAGFLLCAQSGRRRPLRAALGALCGVLLAAFAAALALSPFPASWLSAWGWVGGVGLAKALIFLWVVQGIALAPLWAGALGRGRAARGGGAGLLGSSAEPHTMPYGVAIALGVGLAAWLGR